MSKNIINERQREKKKKRKKEREKERKREKEMEKIEEMSLFQYYENEIMFFEKKTDELLLESILQEIQISKKRRKRLRSCKEDINLLTNLIASTIKAIAIVETYKYFQILKIVPTEENIQFFYVKREQCFEDLLTIFLSKVKREKSKSKSKRKY